MVIRAPPPDVPMPDAVPESVPAALQPRLRPVLGHPPDRTPAHRSCSARSAASSGC